MHCKLQLIFVLIFVFLGAIAGLTLAGLALCFKGILDELKRRRGE